MSWREDLTLALEPAYQLDLLYHGSVTFTAGVGIEDGEASPRAGAIIPLRFGNLLLRAYPDNRALEIGATGKGWLIALHADDMPGSAPSVGTLVLGIGPVAF
ncbi:MAG: hypothetical protein BWY76_00375 [bacterium ADurb.Bin429]|nr:MAG: hypothetical protein BWY76_00375 [bacterium ADurb.Bin429]